MKLVIAGVKTAAGLVCGVLGGYGTLMIAQDPAAIVRDPVAAGAIAGLVLTSGILLKQAIDDVRSVLSPAQNNQSAQ